MNAKTIKQVNKLGLSISEVADRMNLLSQAAKNAIRSISELPGLVKRLKKTHGLKDW